MDTIKKYFNSSTVVENDELTAIEENERLHFYNEVCNESENNKVNFIIYIKLHCYKLKHWLSERQHSIKY